MMTATVDPVGVPHMTESFLLIAALGAVVIGIVGFLIGRYLLPHERRASVEMTEQLRAQVLRLENAFASASSERDRVIAERDTASGRAGEAEARLAAFSERDRLLR
jgi:hypothetical protein